MLIDTLGKEVIEDYCQHLKIVGMLSRLSSESESPYINSRIAENTFCFVTGAENLGRADCSADAKLNKMGIGIKTFLSNNDNTMQKIAEFNRDAYRIRNKEPEEIIEIICNLRNERIYSTMRIYGLDQMIYHCIVRDHGLIKICEFPMDSIDIGKINNLVIKKNGSVIYFSDDKNEYSFNLNKNTLYKRFSTSSPLLKTKVDILANPYNTIFRMTSYDTETVTNVDTYRYESVILPLFSDQGTRNVPKKSGLNQWNAAGRPRNEDEVYIPIPAWIHKAFPSFFPNRDEVFILELPDGNKLSAKVCQDGGKALMSNPNLELGKWLLREVMNLKERELLTYEKLLVLDIDSVEINKIADGQYKIDFRPIGTYDDFVEKHSEEGEIK